MFLRPTSSGAAVWDVDHALHAYMPEFRSVAVKGQNSPTDQQDGQHFLGLPEQPC